MNIKTISKLSAIALLIGSHSIFATNAMAAPSEALISEYNMAAEGDEDKVEIVYEQLNQQIQSQGADALSMVYLGSTQTLMGRDAFMPWNKMKYTEQGLSTISKGLALLDSLPVDAQEYRQGLPEALLAKAIAASTFTSLPDMFNHFDRGYDLYLELMGDDDFAHQNYEATSWIYIYAIKASLRAGDVNQATEWLSDMQKQNAEHPMTLQAEALVNKAA
ncbi:hypothetical protein [Vibrio genomosp. F10]|uniref:Sel1 repeat family protein n=2 Tax=Vibrio genomosp. F10 TaxID=723171 RepID=A0A1B9QY36_9VIBR|nr:hypothetical protein [Vibrio genomosp. F10]OCH75060.1 hypothetical protein A6E14_02045 [Vibrio genomosp. F10]OEE30853.1 hypothetical protein A1QO_16130 [Vibrio genomosp. F10 str. ZF-129]OEE98058.1 hypothetical protein A1QM_02310 [Vibrio genomosp. F10 str. 9ZC157]OEF03196.1 hypothetical protein A1QK_00180 [Vibrio genomosp. F10 str. 9ZD137]OEF05331.1 hypothetical protein A1QI_08185 [Vibrio genomosp. F10 str. 9ZB36]